jgi:hypothetical protein
MSRPVCADAVLSVTALTVAPVSQPLA